MPLRLYRVIMACLRCLYRVCIECYRFHCAVTETARSCHGNHCAPAALPLRPSAFAIALWANPTKWYKSSLVITTPIVCSSVVNIIMAVERQQAVLFIAYMHVQQVQDDANVVHIIQRRRRRRAPRRRIVWVRQWLDVDRRLQYGHYHRLMYELRYEDPASYFHFLMSKVYVTLPLSLPQCRVLKYRRAVLKKKLWDAASAVWTPCARAR